MFVLKLSGIQMRLIHVKERFINEMKMPTRECIL